MENLTDGIFLIYRYVYDIKKLSKQSMGKMEEVKTNCEHFNWGALIEEIEKKRIIPVIGPKLYTIVRNQGEEIHLYDYLAEKIMAFIERSPYPVINTTFDSAVLAFRKYLIRDMGHTEVQALITLRNYLSAELDRVLLPPNNPLQKLVSIEGFNLFINTTYDDLLRTAISSIRSHSCKSHNYTIRDRGFKVLNDDLFDNLANYKCSLIYHLFGNLRESLWPAFTKQEMMETMVSFQRDLEDRPDSRLREALNNKSLLILGFERDEPFINLLLHSISITEVISNPMHSKRIYIIYDGGSHTRKGNQQEFQAVCPVEYFVACLIHRLKQHHPRNCFQKPKNFDAFPFESFKSQAQLNVEDENSQKKRQKNAKKFDEAFSKTTTAFISYDRRDKKVVSILAKRLREDGIKIWMDYKNLDPGDDIDEIIEKKIKQSPAFIPIISQKSQSTKKVKGQLKYHFYEWECAYWSKKDNKNPERIIPVYIDESPFTYRKFIRFNGIKIKDGENGKGYEKLKQKLLEMQEEKECAKYDETR